MAGGNKVEEAKKGADDAASAVKSAVPEQPQQAAKDAASAVQSALPEKPVEAAKDAAAAAKDNVPEAPKDIPNPFQSFFSGRPICCLSRLILCGWLLLLLGNSINSCRPTIADGPWHWFAAFCLSKPHRHYAAMVHAWASRTARLWTPHVFAA